MADGDQEQARLQTLIRFASQLEESSPYVTVDDLVQRAEERRILPFAAPEIAALVQVALGDGIFFTDARTLFDRASGTFRDVTLLRVNRRHPEVQKAEGRRQ
ncbi:MAG: hypothetical protein HY690_06635 [Chloroflexi bacterium]|nr:hypothetical protein [Chloroflexota bacterium]